MNKLIAVEGCTIEYSTSPDNIDLSLSTSLSAPSQKVLQKGNKAYKDKITITVLSGSITLTSTPEGASSNTGTVPPGSIDITGTSEKSKTKGESFVLVDDEGSSTFVCVFPQSSGSSPIPVDVTITAKITDAGQNVLKAT